MTRELRILISGSITLTRNAKIVSTKKTLQQQYPITIITTMSSLSELPTLCIDTILGYIDLKELRNLNSPVQLMWPVESTLELQRREHAARPIITEFLTNAYNSFVWINKCSGNMDSCRAAIDTIFNYKSLATSIWSGLCESGANIFAKPEHITKALNEYYLESPNIYKASGRNYHFIYVLYAYVYH